MKGNKNSHEAVLFAVNLALFTVFALSLSLALLAGAGAFRDIAAQSRERFDERTPLLYFANKLRGADGVELTEIAETDGTPAILIPGETADVYIYLRDGYIRELNVFPGESPRGELGIALFPAESAAFSRPAPNLVEVAVNGKNIFIHCEP